MTERHDVRAELSRLMYDGLAGRKPGQLFKQLRELFERHGLALSHRCFEQWLHGITFPANRIRQELVALAVGGPCGDAIRRLVAPPFRGYRRAIMHEKEEHMGMNHVPAHSARHFPHISVRGEDGRTHQRPLIICAECETRETCVRNGSEEAVDKFRKKGWVVGKDSRHDYCPMCVKARNEKGKVVKMEDHVKNNEEKRPGWTTLGGGKPEQPAEMTREEGRILSRLIEDRWDEERGCYKPGWSDAKLAAEVGKPVEWVRQRRELDFGGVGEDPGVVEFIRSAVALNTDVESLKLLMNELTGEVSGLTAAHEKVQRMLEKYRDHHNTVATKASRLREVADKLGPFPVPDERKAG